jgi:OOP family OmpA-OmpF porin
MSVARPRAVVSGALLVLATAGFGSACGAAAQQGRLEGLKQTIEQAKSNGALRCAPRELAMAESHARFAELELAQGSLVRADEHLAIAVPNAHAALDLSPAERCTDRPVVVAKPVPKPGDRDGDGITDNVDKCPDVPENFNGYQDEDGCPDDPDTDGDGIPDSKDACPTVKEDTDGYLDDDGCPDPDNDADGILDAVDKCPNEAEDPDGFEDADGCPEPDNDHDGVLDLDDACPLDPGPADNKGCPKKPALVVVTSGQISIKEQIHFEFGKSKIKPDSFPILNAVVQVLRDNSQITLEIGGHTDNKGTPSLNKKLSDDRAAAVRAYLVEHGIDAGRLTSRGYGQDVPIDTNATEAGRAKNRRVEFIRTDGSSKSGTP